MTKQVHGWYQWWSIWKDNYKNRAQEVLDEGSNVGMAVVTLPREGDIPQELMDTMYRNMRDARDTGLMTVVRFRYGDKVEDATTQQIISHVYQLSHFFHEFSDVILTVQAGFIGHYGEWHYSDWLETGKAHLCHNATPEARETIATALYGATPEGMIISFRTAKFIKELDRAGVLIEGLVGFNNDALWSSNSEMGTWSPSDPDSKEEQMDYLLEKCSIFGGETAAAFETNESPSQMYSHMRKLPYQYISRRHRDHVVNKWHHPDEHPDGELDCFDMLGEMMEENAASFED